MIATRQKTERGPRGLWTPLVAGLLLLATGTAGAKNLTLTPTGTPADYAAARSALALLAPGDTLTFGSGRFDWSANLTDTLAVSGVPGGLAITVSRLTVLGRSGAIVAGPVDAAGLPRTMTFGTNCAFRNAPGVDGVAIKGLTLTGFENGIVLTQADTLKSARPRTIFKDGSRGWRIENLSLENCFFGITANGRHVDLGVRRCVFRMKLWDGGKGRLGSFAVSIRPLPPTYRGLPERIVVDENEIHGPPNSQANAALSGIVVTGDSVRVTRNVIDGYRVGITGEGRGLIVSNNTITGGAIGIVAWTTGVLGTETEGAFVVRNTIRGMRYLPSGFLTGFGGAGILVAGTRKSEFSGNTLEDNTAADIVFGGVRTTPASRGNRVRDNSGSVLITKGALAENAVDSGRLLVREMSKPGAAPPPSDKPGDPPGGETPKPGSH